MDREYSYEEAKALSWVLNGVMAWKRTKGGDVGESDEGADEQEEYR